MTFYFVPLGSPHPEPDLRAAVALHEEARKAWRRAKTADQVAHARRLSAAAAESFCPNAEWQEELDAACCDAEAGHAASLHRDVIGLLLSPRSNY